SSADAGTIFANITGTRNITVGHSSGTTTMPGAVTHSSTLAQTGVQTNAEAIAFPANGASGPGRICRSASHGLQMRGMTGSSNDINIENAAAVPLILNPTGTSNLTVGNSGGTTTMPGAVTMSSTLAVTGVITATSAAFSLNDNEATPWEVYQGSNVYLRISTINSNERVTIGNSATNPTINFPSNGTHTFNGPVVLSSTLAVTGTASLSDSLVFSGN